MHQPPQRGLDRRRAEVQDLLERPVGSDAASAVRARRFPQASAPEQTASRIRWRWAAASRPWSRRPARSRSRARRGRAACGRRDAGAPTGTPALGRRRAATARSRPPASWAWTCSGLAQASAAAALVRTPRHAGATGRQRLAQAVTGSSVVGLVRDGEPPAGGDRGLFGPGGMDDRLALRGRAAAVGPASRHARARAVVVARQLRPGARSSASASLTGIGSVWA